MTTSRLLTDEKLEKKIEKLSKLYDLSKPADLFTLLPQEMEIYEIIGIYNKANGLKRKEAVTEIMLGLAEHNNVKLDPELLDVFINVISKAAAGYYAINKPQIKREL